MLIQNIKLKREDAILTRPLFASIITEKCPNGDNREIRTKPREGQSGLYLGHHKGAQARGQQWPCIHKRAASQ